MGNVHQYSQWCFLIERTKAYKNVMFRLTFDDHRSELEELGLPDEKPLWLMRIRRSWSENSK